MALIQKTSPTGIDTPIDDFQVYLYGALAFMDWDCYHRVYFNPGVNGLVAERYESNGEYDETFYNDDFALTSFFLVAPNRTINEDGIEEADVSLIMQADLPVLYPSVTHRADEELNQAVRLASRSFWGTEDFTLEGIETTINNVYREFDKSKLRLDDMSNQYVVRFNYKVRYTPKCTP